MDDAVVRAFFARSRPSTNRASTITLGYLQLQLAWPASRPSTNRASTITSSSCTCSSRSPSLGRQPTEQVRSQAHDRRYVVSVRVSAVNQPSKYDHTDHGRHMVDRFACLGRQPTEQVRSPATLVAGMGGLAESRPSTNRASTITRGDDGFVADVGVSAVNQPSKYDHEPVADLSNSIIESRPSTNRASTITRASNDRCSCAMESRPSTNRASTITLWSSWTHRGSGRLAVNQPSKYDHAANWVRQSPVACLGRQPTEQVRSRCATCADSGDGHESRPSTNRASTITVNSYSIVTSRAYFAAREHLPFIASC